MNQSLADLTSNLANGSVEQRIIAAQTLCKLAGEGRGAAVALARATGDSDDSVRELAVGALEEIGAPEASDLSALAELLASGPADVAYWAATLLGRLAAAASAATGALAAALAETHPTQVRQRAAWALGKLAPPPTRRCRNCKRRLHRAIHGLRDWLKRLSEEFRPKGREPAMARLP